MRTRVDERSLSLPEFSDILALLLIGLFAGLVGGLLGVGGSIVMIPAMTEVLGPNQHLYQAAAMIVNLFVVLPAVVQHKRAGAIERATVLRLVPLAGLAVIGGVLFSELPIFHGDGERRLRGLFGLFLLFAAAVDLLRLIRRHVAKTAQAKNLSDVRGLDAPASVRPGWASMIAVSVPTGLIAGLLGVGGGLVAVPLQRRLLHIPIRNAIANSATIIIATSLIGASLKNYTYITSTSGDIEPLVLALVLIPTAMLGSMAGSWMTHRVSTDIVKGAFFVLLVIAAVRLILGSLSSGAS